MVHPFNNNNSSLFSSQPAHASLSATPLHSFSQLRDREEGHRSVGDLERLPGDEGRSNRVEQEISEGHHTQRPLDNDEFLRLLFL